MVWASGREIWDDLAGVELPRGEWERRRAAWASGADFETAVNIWWQLLGVGV